MYRTEIRHIVPDVSVIHAAPRPGHKLSADTGTTNYTLMQFCVSAWMICSQSYFIILFIFLYTSVSVKTKRKKTY